MDKNGVQTCYHVKQRRKEIILSITLQLVWFLGLSQKLADKFENFNHNVNIELPLNFLTQ